MTRDNETKLLVEQNTTEQHSNNKGMSGSIGVSIGTEGLMFNAGLSGRVVSGKQVVMDVRAT